MTGKKTKIQYLDTLRAIAMMGVIINHVTTPVIKMMYGRNMEFWWIGNSIQSVFRFDIAIFLMLSGATMLGKEYDLTDYFKKRFTRVLLPFLFWLVAYWVYRWAILSPKLQPHEFTEIIKWASNLFVTEGVSKHFWYIYMILILYLFIPLLGKIIRKSSNTTIKIVLLVWLMLCSVFSMHLVDIHNWSYFALKAKDYALYTGFIVAGFYLIHAPFPATKFRALSATVYLSTVLFTAISTYVASKNAHKLDLSFYNAFSLNTIIQAFSFVLLLKDTTFTNKVLLWLSKTIGDYSYGIYLVHIMVIGIFFQYKIFWTMAYPLISLPVIVLMTLTCSYAIVFVLRKIPGGQYISG